MRLEHENPEKLKRQVAGVILKHLHPKKYEVFFFGSRVSGGGNERSDIDVGIKGKDPISPLILAQIRDAIEELPTLYTIEVIDFANTSKEFRKVAERFIEPIL